MVLSKNWNMTDNLYALNRMTIKVIDNFNDGVMCLFEKEHDGKVNRCVAEYAKQHGRKEGLLFNNRLFPLDAQDRHKKQYNANRNWIINNIKA